MTTAAFPSHVELINISLTRNQKGIEGHLKTAAHLQAAAKSHIAAATYHREGEHEKAAESTIIAQGFIRLAIKAQKQDAEQHAS